MRPSPQEAAELRVAELEEENAFLRRELAMEDDEALIARLRVKLKLTRQEAAVVSALYWSPRPLPAHVIEDRVPPRSGGLRTMGNEVARVLVLRVRRKLGRDSVKTIYGAGYDLSPETREACAALANPRPSVQPAAHGPQGGLAA